MTDDGLKTLFSAHGTVVRAKVVTDRETGRSRGFAFVTMGSEAEGTAAINALNNSSTEGRTITVRKSEPRPQGGAGGGGGERGGFRGPRQDRGDRGGYGGGRPQGGGYGRG